MWLALGKKKLTWDIPQKEVQMVEAGVFYARNAMNPLIIYFLTVLVFFGFGWSWKRSQHERNLE